MPYPKIQRVWFRFARFACRIFLKLCFRLRFYGIENVPDCGPVVLVGNHQSFLDPVLCGILIKRHMHYLARDTLFKNRLFARLLTSVNTSPVKRGQADLTAIRKAVALLKQQNALCLFPEATRTTDGKISPFKPGFGLLCRKGGAAVVPVLIDGAFECWPKNKKIFTLGKEIIISYGNCIPSDRVAEMSDEQLADNLTQILHSMQNNCRLEHKKQPYDYNQ
jgi:1-acyl-sn-glycerol-3-phosphate acyltransferase